MINFFTNFFVYRKMAQRRNSKAKTFQFRIVSLNEVLNPNLQFQSLYSQNLFEEHKVIVDNLWCETPKNPDFLRKDKMVILVKIRNFSRSRLMKRTSLLESSREI